MTRTKNVVFCWARERRDLWKCGDVFSEGGGRRRRMQKRRNIAWVRSERRRRYSLSLAIPALCILLLLFLLLGRGKESESEKGMCERGLYPQPWELHADQMTVLMSGFSEARLPLIQSVASRYSASRFVHSVFVLWGNTSTPPSVLNAVVFRSGGAPIAVVRQESPSLNDRFLPRPYIATRAILVCDDDIALDVESIELAFQTWLRSDSSIAGFFPRSHEYDITTHSWIYTVHPNKYSIVLTKSMIFATEFLFRYTCEMPDGIKEYVDHVVNCEDIAMNFLVANYSQQGPLLIHGRPRDWGDTRNSGNQLSGSALSGRGEHRKKRGDCITAFHRLWGSMPLRYSHGKVIDGVEDQSLCEKHGKIISCAEEVSTKRTKTKH